MSSSWRTVDYFFDFSQMSHRDAQQLWRFFKSTTVRHDWNFLCLLLSTQQEYSGFASQQCTTLQTIIPSFCGALFRTRFRKIMLGKTLFEANGKIIQQYVTTTITLSEQ